MVEHLERGDVQPLVVDQVGLGQRDHAMTDADQLEDAQVFFALWLPALGCSNHEQARIDTADARQHVGQEADVAGDIDEADAIAGRQNSVGEPEVDGETAPLLLGEAIRIGAGDGEDQRTLAMIDVTGRGDDTHVSRSQGW
jgi:hypothetical protein